MRDAYEYIVHVELRKRLDVELIGAFFDYITSGKLSRYI